MPVDGRKLNMGKSKNLTFCDKRTVLWTMQGLLKSSKPSTSTINCCLNKYNYKYLQLRKKGLLTSSNKRKRLHSARSFKKLPVNFWKDDVSFYLDRVSFVHKTNP